MRKDTKKETAILTKRFPGAEYISPWADAEHGIDYGILFPNKAKLNIFVQAAEKGSSKNWRPTNQRNANGETVAEPELLLEIWANKETKEHGWPFNEKKTIDYVLFTFDESDAPNPYIVAYQDIKEVFKAKFHEWKASFGTRETSTGDGRISEYCPVPVTVVLNSIISMVGERAEEQKRQELYGNIIRGGNKA